MRAYETVFILKPELSTEQLEAHLEFYKDSILKHGGEIVNVDAWGKVALAYKIDNIGEGVYYVVKFNATVDYITELEKRFKFNEDVMRFVIVQLDEKKFKASPRREAVKRERRPRADEARRPRTGGRRPRPENETAREVEADAEETEA